MSIIYILCLLPLYFWLTVTSAHQTQELTVAGTVVDETGEPLSAVSIYVKDKAAAGTSTDANGGFSINVAYGDRLVFTYVGYEPFEHVVVESTNNLSLALTSKSEALEEVVVVGLGSTTRDPKR